MDNWRQTKKFAYIVRVTESIDGESLAELRKKYFTVGIAGRTEDIPFLDLLVVFSLIEQEYAVLRDPRYQSKKNFKVNYQVITDWPDEQAVRLLSGIQIQTHEQDRFLRIVATGKPTVDTPDDPQPE